MKNSVKIFKVYTFLAFCLISFVGCNVENGGGEKIMGIDFAYLDKLFAMDRNDLKFDVPNVFIADRSGFGINEDRKVVRGVIAEISKLKIGDAFGPSVVLDNNNEITVSVIYKSKNLSYTDGSPLYLNVAFIYWDGDKYGVITVTQNKTEQKNWLKKTKIKQ
ncbi:MAG: hypothetical protein LBV16_00985 [Elusimicrobiota bacterium]|jgi:hypothetical protein|nr:hypothetical protein [Elusimicrobiota bacterium]